MSKKICSIKGCKKSFWTRNSVRTNCLKHDPGLKKTLMFRAAPKFKKVKHTKTAEVTKPVKKGKK